MDRFEAMRVFVRVVDRRSFGQAAEDLLLSRSSVSEAVQQLEARLGVLLLQRTTRRIAITHEGERYYGHCRAILADVEELETGFLDSRPAGPLRIDVHGALARHVLFPHLPKFLGDYPGIRLHVGEGDRLVDLVREGVDCVIRVGEPADSSLTGRRLGWLREATLASPDYVARHGMPASPDDLAGHRMIGFVSSATGAVMPLEFQTPDGLRFVSLPAAATVTSAQSNADLCRLGLGMIQAPRYNYERDLAEGCLVELLPQTPPSASPVHILHVERRQPSPRVRVFVDWAISLFSRALPATPWSVT